MAFSDPVRTPASGTQLVDRLHWGLHWSDGDSNGSTSLAVYIAGVTGTETFDYGGTPMRARTTIEEANAYRAAMAMFEKVCNIDFVEVGDQKDADIILAAIGPKPIDGALGEAMTPGDDVGPRSQQQGAVIINREGYVSDDYSSLQAGGYDFITFIHELGHAVGLKHPHDTGGGYFPAFPRVYSEFDQLGRFQLNQGIHTMMTYNDGWMTGPKGPRDSHQNPANGWQTVMALDIAALQDLYGANMTTATGDDRYVLPSANVPGSYFSTIWDAGGVDTISATGTKDCVIDLRAATLNVARAGGGQVSYQDGVLGGFTIAHGVVIENATGASGGDVLTGNDADNVLKGRGGGDTIRGGLGADTLTGGAGRDHFLFEDAEARLRSPGDTITDFSHADTIDLSDIDANGRGRPGNSFQFIGDEVFLLRAGQLRFEQDAANRTTLVEADMNGDGVADFSVILNGLIGLTAADFIL